MQSQLLNRSLGETTVEQFEQLATESLYYDISPLEYPRFPLKKKVSPINCLDFDKTESRFLLSGGSDATIKVWKVGTRRATTVGSITKATGGHSFGITGVQWWPFDQGMFLSSSYDTTVRVWDSNTLEEAFMFELGSKVNCFDISPTGEHSLIATGAESTHIRVLDLRTTSAAHTLSGHNGTILSCKWSPVNPYMLATGSSEGEVRLWDIRKTASCFAQLDLYRTDKSKAVSENKSKKVEVMKSSVKAHAGGVNGLCWLENGETLISTATDEKIRVWDLDAPGGVNTLLNFGPFVKNKTPSAKSLVLSPVGETEVQYLWFPADSGEMLMFRLGDGKLIARLRRNLQDTARSTCVVYGGNNCATYFSGTSDGRIFVWGPKIEDET